MTEGAPYESKIPLHYRHLLKTDDEEKFLPFQNPTTYKDITVELKPNGEALRVYVTADTTPVQRVTLYFADLLPEKAQVLGVCLGARLRRL